VGGVFAGGDGRAAGGEEKGLTTIKAFERRWRAPIGQAPVGVPVFVILARLGPRFVVEILRGVCGGIKRHGVPRLRSALASLRSG